MPCAFNTCCFCVELRLGALITGYLNMIWNIILTAALFWSIVNTTILAIHSKGDIKHAAQIDMTLSAVSLIFVIANLVFIMKLLIYIHNYQRQKMRICLIFNFIFVVFSITLCIVGIYLNIGIGDNVSNLANMLFSIFYLAVVRSYHVRMDIEAEESGETEPLIF